jgi:hypothetical protein
MGSSWSRREQIIRLAKLRSDKAALAILCGYGDGRCNHRSISDCQRDKVAAVGGITESELRALWGDR